MADHPQTARPEIEYIRDLIIGPLDPGPIRPRPFPELDPRSLINPGVEINPRFALQREGREVGLRQPSSMATGDTMNMARVEPTAASQPLVGRLSQAANMVASSELQLMALSTATDQFRHYLTINFGLIRHLLCLIHPLYVTKQLIATATTDMTGRFEASFYQSIFDFDQPDLYFIAKQQVNSPPAPITTIYERRPVACYTYWNYRCGSEVTLVTDQGIACPPSPYPDLRDGVVVGRIGDYPLDKIHGTSLRLGSTDSKLGSTDSNRGLTEAGQPWGGDLRLFLEFDPDLPTTQVSYYKVSYRKVYLPPTDPAFPGPTSFTELNSAINWTAVKFLDGTPVYSSHEIGPVNVGSGHNFYHIYSRGKLAPDGGSWSPQGEGGVVINNTNALFPSSTLAPGLPDNDPSQPPRPDSEDRADKYQIKVELFSSTGAPVNLVAAGIRFFVPPSVAGNIPFDDASQPLLNLVHNNAFIFTLHVDNNPPVARINSLTLDGTSAGECGAFEYTRSGTPPTAGGSVKVKYIGGHRNGFATYSFTMSKGGGEVRFSQPNPPNPLTPGPVGDSSHDFVWTGTDTVAHLLDTCTVAGMLATVTVNPMAFTGWGGVHGQARADFAFALAPKEHPTPTP